jgi:large-conductance mechanosensitive channel
VLQAFKAFILRGNMLDLAVAVVIGAAFGVVIASLVANIVTPTSRSRATPPTSARSWRRSRGHGLGTDSSSTT